MLNLQIAPASSGPKMFIKLVGQIAEDATFAQLNLDGRLELHINTGGIDYINSAGISSWVKWIGQLKSKYPLVTIFLDDVPYTLLKQVTTVDNFLPENSGIGSILVPFTCDDCFKSIDKVFVMGKDFSSPPTAEELVETFEKGLPCECGQTLQVDAHPSIIIKALVKFAPKKAS